MLYTMPDGRSFELDKVTRVSKVRDNGEDPNSIEYSTVSFHIHLSGNEVLNVSQNYHYADWSEQKKKLTGIRNDLLAALSEHNIEVDDS